MLGLFAPGQSYPGQGGAQASAGGFYQGSIQNEWLAGKAHSRDMLVVKDWNWQYEKLKEQEQSQMKGNQ